MAVLPSQRLKTSRYRSRFDPIYRDSYLLLGVVTVIFGLATAIMEWSRFGELAFGITLLSLFGFYFLELFREQAPRTIAYIISCFSVLGIIGPIQQFSSTIWTLFVADRGDVCKYYLPLTDRICNDFRFRQELRDNFDVLAFDLLPLVLLISYFALVFRNNRALSKQR